MAFSELNDSSGSFSYITPSSDQDIDDVTLGKLLTEAHRGQADYFDPEGRVVLRGDVVKDDSGSYAVFTEQGSSASQMTAAKVMDIISRLPGCAGQAAYAVSAYTLVKMEDAHKLLKIPKSEWNVQTFGFVYHDTNGLNHGPVWKIRSFLLNGICTVILWQDYYGKGNLRKSY